MTSDQGRHHRAYLARQMGRIHSMAGLIDEEADDPDLELAAHYLRAAATHIGRSIGVHP